MAGPAYPGGLKAVSGRSPIGCWMGGKYMVSNKIVPLIPAHMCYVEPFCGAAWIFFRKRRSPVEVLNDINGELVNFYRQLKSREGFAYLREEAALALHSREIFETMRDMEREEVFALTDAERAWRMLYLLKTSFATRGVAGWLSRWDDNPCGINGGEDCAEDGEAGAEEGAGRKPCGIKHAEAGAEKHAGKSVGEIPEGAGKATCGIKHGVGNGEKIGRKAKIGNRPTFGCWRKGKVEGRLYPNQTRRERPPIRSCVVNGYLEAAHERLGNAIIERLPYGECIKRYDAEDTFFYLDPPYINCEKDYGEGIFGREDFARLADLLAGIKGKFILSLNAHPEALRIFGRFPVLETGNVYSMNHQGNTQVKEYAFRNFPVDLGMAQKLGWRVVNGSR